MPGSLLSCFFPTPSRPCCPPPTVTMALAPWRSLLSALLELLIELFFGAPRLGAHRLQVRAKGVDRAHAASSKGRGLRAFIDGSVQPDGSCGFSVFYHAGHPLNAHGRFEPAPCAPDSNLAELVALFWALVQHPRGQHLTVFSDSAHALRCVQPLEEGPVLEGDAEGGAKRQPPPSLPSDARWSPIVRLIWMVLRLRTAQTVLVKVPGHKGVRHNETADALAQRGAGLAAAYEVPHRASRYQACVLLLRYLRQPDACLATLSGGPPAVRPPARRPEPSGPGLGLTEVLALDCEMVGVGPSAAESKLASVCVVNSSGNSVYFSYAKPSRHVTSYRTEFSGIEPHMLEGAPSVETVQREVRELVQGRIVVGHGLENDFGVLGLNHPRHLVRDTAHDLPRLLRSNGKPRKLRHITYEWLGLTIQGGESGHDPCEDARAALLLYQRFQRQFDEQVALRERARAKVEAQRATEGGEKEAGLADDAAAAADAATGCVATAARGSPLPVSTATGPSRRRASKGGKTSNKYRL
eukprot:scaffold115845_cov58-Phaeocystis_antarctica.AAC.5